MREFWPTRGTVLWVVAGGWWLVDEPSAPCSRPRIHACGLSAAAPGRQRACRPGSRELVPGNRRRCAACDVARGAPGPGRQRLRLRRDRWLRRGFRRWLVPKADRGLDLVASFDFSHG